MSRPRVLIDAANLHVGGGVQVAASFIDEVAALREDPDVCAGYPWLRDVDVEASPVVVDNLAPGTASTMSVQERSRGPLDLRAWTRHPRHDVAFTVFGPLYARRLAATQIVGFADGTSIFDAPAGLPERSRADALRARVRREVSRRCFRRADHLVVEARHVQEALVRRWGIDAKRITIVPNCVHASLREPAVATSTPRQGWCFVARAYPHKNIPVLGRIGAELERRGVHDVRFTVTLTGAEWSRLDAATRRVCDNVGPLRVSDLAELYARSEGAVFPSLLESFSVTPLEALATGTPLVASDRDFVRDQCGDAAWYADPEDPAAWADAIVALRTTPTLREHQIRRGHAVIDASPTARDRALMNLAVIDRALGAR